MRAFFPILLATALLSGCGTDETTPPATGPSQDEVNRVCAGVHCTAGYCTSEGGVAACRCGPLDQELGSTCEVEEVDDFDEVPNPGPQQRGVPLVALAGRLHRLDVDAFTFWGVKGRTYRFTCTPEGFQWCHLAITPWPTPFDHGLVTYEGRDTVLTVSLANSMMHTASVAAWPARFSTERGTYTVSLVEVGDAEGPPDVPAKPIPTDGTLVSGHVDFQGDEDTFAFTALAGHVYRARCAGQDLTPAIESVMPLEAWRHFEWEEGGSSTAVVKLRAGAHRLRIGSHAALGTTAYQCTLEDLGEDDHADEADGATALPAFASELALTGALETRSDADWFSFPAKAGHAYDLVCDRATQFVCASSFIAIPSTLPTAKAEMLPVALKEDGLLWVQVSNPMRSDILTNPRGPYALRVVDLGPDQGSGVEDAVPASVGVPIPGVFAPHNDKDTFRVNVEAGHVYRLRLADRVVSSVFEAYRPSEPGRNLMLFNLPPKEFFKSTRSEPIVFLVGGVQGPYVFIIEDVGQDDHADALEDATVVPAPMLYAEGWIDTSHDEDWFAFDLEARAYEVRAFPQDGSGAPGFALLEADGVTPVPTQAGTGDVRPVAPGRYFLHVGHPFIPATPGTPYRWELHPR
ncbi:hypothetical protein [Corallococcus exercitus]|uniref:EGF-like domain-containing protein n=1 Tax=Corallococcus exercitus TaxID=2316736 RepID=A0A7Y4ND61_9BACT|nr:hypothetical protein [Corallococcus exercitus]NOK09594.1 hypothetical protein [Corallococcus exercitus]